MYQSNKSDLVVLIIASLLFTRIILIIAKEACLIQKYIKA